MTPAAGDPPEKDHSMDDILASIRRIMLDEQVRLQEGAAAATPPSHEPSSAPVLILDASMAVDDPSEPGLPDLAETEATPDPPEPEAVPLDAALVDVAVPVAQDSEISTRSTVSGATAGMNASETPVAEHVMVTTQTIEALLAPAAAAAAAASVDALLRQLNDERLALLKPDVPSGSPTIEEVVRSELRPLLKSWLDEHLPPLVELLVRAGINRLIGRPGL